jgi:fibrillarin-like pre-rRNA processing protein
LKEIFPGVFKIGEQLATRNLAPGKSVYGEKRVTEGGVEYRFWDPWRSKLGAAIMRGLKTMPIKSGNTVLYLGAAQGTTPSHVADIVGKNGIVICIDIAPKTFEKLLEVCETRENLLPVLADANAPEGYAEYVEKKVDVVYQDLAQREQAKILVKNVRSYLKKGGYAVFMIKARSIDVTAEPSSVFAKEIVELKKAGLEVVETKPLEPYEKDHVAVVARLRD